MESLACRLAIGEARACVTTPVLGALAQAWCGKLTASAQEQLLCRTGIPLALRRTGSVRHSESGGESPPLVAKRAVSPSGWVGVLLSWGRSTLLAGRQRSRSSSEAKARDRGDVRGAPRAGTPEPSIACVTIATDGMPVVGVLSEAAHRTGASCCATCPVGRSFITFARAGLIRPVDLLRWLWRRLCRGSDAPDRSVASQLHPGRPATCGDGGRHTPHARRKKRT